MSGRVAKTMAVLMLSAMTGCATGPFHRKAAPAPVSQPEAPELSQTPLYSPEMSESNPPVPNLPPTQGAAVAPAPAPVVQKPHRLKRPKPNPPVAKTAAPGPAKGGTPSADSGPAVTSAGTSQTVGPSAADAGTAAGTSSERKPGSQTVAAGASPGGVAGASPIGELTTGSSADAAQTGHQTADLIKTTREGLDGIRRSLSSDERKTTAEIRTFLSRAQQALKNGDVDGAYGLATKAKLLLDELTQN